MGATVDTRWCRNLSKLFLCLSLLLGPSLLYALELEQPDYDKERILQLKVGGYLFDDVLIAYQYGDTLYVPLGQLASIIDLAVRTSPNVGTAQGFVFREGRTFILDVDQGIVVLDGRKQPLDRSRLKLFFDDIYIDSNLYSQWFPFEIEADLLASQLIIHPHEKLPFQQRIEREQRISKALKQLGVNRPDYPRYHDPYRLAEIPALDQTLNVGYGKNRDGEQVETYNYSTYAAGDLLGMASNWYLTGNQNDSVNVFRGVLSRSDPEGSLLGPLQATQFALGHVLEPSVDLITQPTLTDAGVMVTNFPLHQPLQYDKHTFSGVLKPGWEVELYHNNSIIGYQRGPTDGEYRFEDIPLLFGTNYFRLVFYGPEGQRDEETYRYEVGRDLTAPGQHYYRLITKRDPSVGQRLLADYEFGIRRQLSGGITAISVPIETAAGAERHNYIRPSLNLSTDNAVWYVSLIEDEQSGSGGEVRVQARLGNSVVGAKHAILNGLVTEVFDDQTSSITERSRLRLDTALPPTQWTPTLPFSLSIRRDRFLSGQSAIQADQRISLQRRGYAVSNQFIWNKVSSAEGNLNGTVQSSFHFERWSLRGDIQYRVTPITQASNVLLTGELYNFHHFNLNTSLNYSILTDYTELGAGMTRDYGKIWLSGNLRYGSEGNYAVEFGLSFGLAYNPRSERLWMKSNSLARYGSVAAHAYLDNNMNMLFDEGDEPLPDVAFDLNETRRPQMTGDSGHVLLTSMPPNRKQNLTLATSSLVDPLMTPAREGAEIVPREGHVTQIDFPVHMTGEVDGIVRLQRDGRLIDVANVEMHLIAEDGKVYAVKTAFDGFYLFSKIPPGEYRLTVAESQLQRLGLQSVPLRTVTINSDNLFVSGQDYILKLQ